MPKEYIEREALFEKLHAAGGCDADRGTWSAGYDAGINLAIDILRNQPTADVVEVVHCQDCIHYSKFGYCHVLSVKPDEYGNGAYIAMEEDSFCSYGEKKDGADNG